MRNELSYNSISGLYSIRAKRDQVKGPTKTHPRHQPTPLYKYGFKFLYRPKIQF